MSAIGELILGCRRRGWRVGLVAIPTAQRRLEVAALEVRDRDRDLLAFVQLRGMDDLDNGCARAAQVLALKGLIA